MLICKWEKLPENMQTEEIRPYWEKLRKRNWNLFWKRIFDIVVSLFMLIVLSPLFFCLAIAIKIDSRGPIFYRQVRITQYGKEFKIHKFRSMIVGADKGSLVTVKDDVRVTQVGKFIRKYRLDEISQLIDVFQGNMSFVGTRPEVPKYVESYSPEMMVSLLLPAGITSEASILYKNESELLDRAKNSDKVYIEEILPAKMYYNLKEIPKEGMFHDIKIMFMTVLAVCGKEYKGDYKKEVIQNFEKQEIGKEFVGK